MKHALTLSILALTLSSCSVLNSLRPGASSGTVRVNLTDPQGKDVGTAVFSREGSGARLRVQVQGLTPGMHGMHIHVNPSCTNSTDTSGNTVIFGGAGGHFDPGSAANHGTPEAPNTVGHGGDMPMLIVNNDGLGTADFYTQKVSLSGANSVLGRSIVIHAAADDFKTNPAGNSGARLVCGVISGD